jgi:hypothetical protein
MIIRVIAAVYAVLLSGAQENQATFHDDTSKAPWWPTSAMQHT